MTLTNANTGVAIDSDHDRRRAVSVSVRNTLRPTNWTRRGRLPRLRADGHSAAGGPIGGGSSYPAGRRHDGNGHRDRQRGSAGNRKISPNRGFFDFHNYNARIDHNICA